MTNTNRILAAAAAVFGPVKKRLAVAVVAHCALAALAFTYPTQYPPHGTWIVTFPASHCLIWTVPVSPLGSLFWAECEDGR
jgi:hypothetical protein